MNSTTRPGLLAAVIAALAVPGAVRAEARESVTAPVEVGPDGAWIPSGTTLVARLDRTISARNADPGERFSATIASSVFDPDGRLLIPAGARISGHVYEVERARGRNDSPALGLAVDSLVIRNSVLPIDGRIAASRAETYRRGIVFRREQLRLREGTPVGIRLVRPIHLADVERALGATAIGGGPRW